MDESKIIECEPTSGKVVAQELNKVNSIQPTPIITLCNSNQLQTPENVRIKRKLPDLANITVVQNFSLTTRQLLENSTIPISNPNSSPVPYRMKGRATPKMPRTPTPNRISTPFISSTPSMNRILEDTTTFKPEYWKEAQKGLKELLKTDRVGQTVQQYCLDKISYNELINSINKEEPRKKGRAPRPRKGPWMVNRRNNRNTRKAKLYRFSQSSFQQNRRVTINCILDGTWGEEILNAALMCRTSLLPKTTKERDYVGSWRPITIGNLLIRIYGRI